jgi:hypothetical protein
LQNRESIAEPESPDGYRDTQRRLHSRALRRRRRLARQLREAPKSRRGELYSTLYDELFRSVTGHPQLRRKQSAKLSAREVRRKLALVGRYLSRRRAISRLEAAPSWA